MRSPLKFFLQLIVLSAIIVGCATRRVAPGDRVEYDLEFDLTSIDSRHGWQILSRPRIEYTGLNDKNSELRGQSLFQQHCQKCHGPTGIGNGPMAEKLKIKPANLKNISFKTTNTYLVVQINEGKGNMPAWKNALTEQQLFDLTNYIRTLSKK